MNRIYLIIAREYAERVRRKSFIITTILMPVLMIGLMAAPTLIVLFTGTSQKDIAVVDNSHSIIQSLDGNGSISFIDVTDSDISSLKADEQYEAILVIAEDIIDNPSNMTLYTHDAASMQDEQFITSQIEDIIERRRIERYNINGLDSIVSTLQVESSIDVIRINGDSEENTSSIVSYVIGMVMVMMLYVFIMLYGQMVMTSVVEEKSNRVLEIIVSSVQPHHIMIGKITGVALVALTQIAIWCAMLLAAGGGMGTLLPTMPAESMDSDVMTAIAQLTDLGYLAPLLALMTLFFIGGFLFYSSIYAAIGSAVDNIQDASQLSAFGVIPIVLAMLIAMAAVADPNSSLAVITSIIPFTSPIVMMARLPFGIPLWQPITSLIVLTISFAAMLWLSAKIYRVGIFMYGKKPSPKDIIKWIRYE